MTEEQKVKPFKKNVNSEKELIEMKTFLEDSWETMAETLNQLSAFQVDDRESIITNYMIAQHRIVLRLIEYHLNNLGESEDGTPTGN